MDTTVCRDMEGLRVIAAHALSAGDRIMPGHPVLASDRPDVVTEVVDRRSFGYMRVILTRPDGRVHVEDFSTMEDVLVMERKG